MQLQLVWRVRDGSLESILPHSTIKVTTCMAGERWKNGYVEYCDKEIKVATCMAGERWKSGKMKNVIECQYERVI